MKIEKINSTYAYTLTVKQMLRWEKLGKDHNLYDMLKGRHESISDLNWDAMFGPYISITVTDDSELQSIGESIKELLRILP